MEKNLVKRLAMLGIAGALTLGSFTAKGLYANSEVFRINVSSHSLNSHHSKKDSAQTFATKEHEQQILDEQHKKDLEFVTSYMITFRNQSEFYKNYSKDWPFSSMVFVDDEVSEKIKKGEMEGKTYNSLMLSYNIDANIIFVTECIADEKQTTFISEKRYVDRNSDGFKIGTDDSISWIFYHPGLKVDITESFSFLKEDSHDASIWEHTRTPFHFSGDKGEYQRRAEMYISEYKKVIHKIASMLRKHSSIRKKDEIAK